MQKLITSNSALDYHYKHMRFLHPHLFILTWIILVNLSCDSANAPDCFKTTGELTSQEVITGPFHSVVVMDEADVYLGNGDEQLVEIRSGRNLIPEIQLEVKDSVLTIRNKNTCNWRRIPGNPGIYINHDRLRRVEIYDFANVFAKDTLVLEQLEIYSDGTGNFDLIVKMDALLVESIYVSNFQFSGKVKFLEIRFGDDSRFDGSELISDINEIHHYGSNLIELFPVEELTGELGSTGSLCYYHEPEYLDVKINHTGKLMDCSE
jgi:hypothetical protein